MAQVKKNNTGNRISQSKEAGTGGPGTRTAAQTENPFITMDRVALRIRDRRILEEVCWTIRTGQQWAVVGPNGAGKSTLVRALAGEVPVVAGRIVRHRPEAEPGAVVYVGFDLHRWITDREERRAEARWFSDGAVAMTTVRRFLLTTATGHAPCADPAPIIEGFRLTHLLDRNLTALSAGEKQRVLLARAVAAKPGLLVLDEPFDGLDQPARRNMHAVIQGLMAENTQLVVVAHRDADLPRGITHTVRISRGRIVSAGPAGNQNPVPAHRPAGKAVAPGTGPERPGPVLVRMRGATIAYGDTVVLDRVDWTVRGGEHWAITGPNGCGKTSLLSLITTEHPQAYANRIDLFGRRRGTGESVWKIREKIGQISPELQLRCQQSATALQVVISGFFDSIGLYRRADDRQLETARMWIGRLGIEPLAPRPFDQLSRGEQRLVLLARAMVKSPRLLIMDEPCQGLDPANRRKILELIDTAVAESRTTLLYVTHHADEACTCIRHVLAFKPAPGGGFRAVCQRV